jgi:menaquinone-dependent protoporphyrinogen oxidase
MRVLVVHASRYGATHGIAQRIAATLRQQGHEATMQSAQHADDPAEYDAVVIGSAIYHFHWRKYATKYLQRYRDVLANRPVWLFSSGPLGSETKDAQGRELCVVLEPKEIAEFRQTINPRDHRVFFGALDPGTLGFTHRLMLELPANRDHALFPEGDFRDWSDIEAWAGSIALALKTPAATPDLATQMTAGA